MVNLNIILTVIIISIILIILILLTLNYFNKIENFKSINGKYGYICNYDSDCIQAESTLCVTDDGYSVYACGYAFGFNSTNAPREIGLTEKVQITNINDITVKDIFYHRSGSNKFILTNNNELLFSGMGVGGIYGEAYPIFTTFSLEQYSLRPIKKMISYDGNNALCITIDEGIYRMTANGYGYNFTYYPSSIFNNDEIKDIYNLFVLTKNGSVYKYHTSSTVFINIPQTNFANKKVVKLMTGNTNVCYALTEDGIVYTNNLNLIIDDWINDWSPLFPLNMKITYMRTWHKNISSFMFVDDTGQCWNLGYNQYGQYYKYPLTEGTNGLKVKKQYRTSEFAFVITEDNEVYSKGKSSYNNLGQGMNGHAQQYSYNKVPTLSNIKKIFIGNSYEVYFLSYDGVLYKSKPGDPGVSNTTERISIFTSPVKKVATIDSGSFYMVLTEDGSVYTKGYNHYGQLGLGNFGLDSTPYTNQDAFGKVTSINLSVNRKLPEEMIIKKISSKGDTTLLITQDGNVYATGKNTYGQLGVGDKDNRYELTPVNKKLNNNSTISNIKQISAFSNHTVILTADGNLYVTGLNENGQLGINSFMAYESVKNFMQLLINNVDKISCGEDSLYVLMNDGTVWVCGLNDYGQLGLGDKDNRYELTKIPNFSNVKDISAKYNSCLFLKNDGYVWACGRNNWGQLGIGSTGDKSTPTKNDYISYIQKIYMGYECSFYIDDGPDVYSCGGNNYGQLGIDSKSWQNRPQRVSSVTNITDISCGSNFNIFLRDNGAVYSCGQGGDGRLGVNDNINRQVPERIPFNTIKIAAISSGFEHTLFLTDNGMVYCCGKNTYGQLGLGNDLSTQNVPIQIDSLTTIETISCGSYHSLFLKNDGTIYGCGINSNGQLGLGDQTDRNIPILIDSFYSIAVFNNIKSVEVGVTETLFITEEGTVYATVDRLPEPILSLNDIREISIGDGGLTTGGGSKFFLTEEDYVYCYGLNNYGQLGLGDLNNRDVPEKIEYDNTGNEFGNIKKIISRGNFCMFLTREGKVYATGLGPNGLGYAAKKPTIIPFISNITDISASAEHSLFLTEDGFVYGCGNNSSGQLASVQPDTNIPRKLNMINMAAISCGKSHSLFLTKYGDVYGCGKNSAGQLASGDSSDRKAPALCNISDINNIYSGDYCSFFTKTKDV